MEQARQTTVAQPIRFEGVALHAGGRAVAVICPAQGDSGVVFRRTDLPGAPTVTASPRNASDCTLGTRLVGDRGGSVRTVEHLMAALAIVGVDNAIVDLDGEEPPVLDGSSGPFVDALERAGLRKLPTTRRCLRILAPVELKDGERWIRAFPNEKRSIEIEIDYPAAAIGRQRLAIDLDDKDTVRRRLAVARTFCLAGDVEAMQARGFGRGGSLDNALVVDGDRLLNEGGLRDAQEFALHKMLDLFGDLALIGMPVHGAVVAHKCGHDLNTAFGRKLLESVGSYAIEPMAAPASMKENA